MSEWPFLLGDELRIERFQKEALRRVGSAPEHSHLVLGSAVLGAFLGASVLGLSDASTLSGGFILIGFGTGFYLTNNWAKGERACWEKRLRSEYLIIEREWSKNKA